MKKIRRTRAARILAGGLAILLTVGLVLLVDSQTGDPWSRAFANRRMLAWANAQWPGNDFYIEEQFGGGLFTYDVQLQSAASADTRFHLGSVLGLWGYTHDYETQVTGKDNTRRRLEEALEKDAAAALQETVFERGNGPGVFAALDGTKEQSALELDMPYDPALARQASLSLRFGINGRPSAEQAKQFAQTARQELVRQGLDFAAYKITLYDETENDYQQKMKSLVEAVFTAGELA